MKKIMIIAGMLASSLTFALTTTSMETNWVCTTNASSSSNEADKAADKQMADTAKSATAAFGFAAQNCRDCTKITCTVKE